MNCNCGNSIPTKRVEFLEKNNKQIFCIECAEKNVSKLGGFMTSVGKTERALIVADMSTINNLHKLAHRAGTGVSKGVKMNQSYSPKHSK